MSTQGVILNVLRRVNAGAEFLYLKRSGGTFRGEWWPVAGTCNPGESALDTLFRELKEETGLVPESIYELGLPIPHTDGKSKLEGFVVFISPAAVVQLNYEHDEYAWLTFEAVLSRIPERVHPLISHIKDNFVHNEPDVGTLVWQQQ